MDGRLDGWAVGWTNGRKDRRTYWRMDRQKIFPFYRTLLPCLPMETKKISFKNISRAGQGNRWPFDAFGRLVTFYCLLTSHLLLLNPSLCLSICNPSLSTPTSHLLLSSNLLLPTYLSLPTTRCLPTIHYQPTHFPFSMPMWLSVYPLKWCLLLIMTEKIVHSQI